MVYSDAHPAVPDSTDERQRTLFDDPPYEPEAHHDGQTYEAPKDKMRLNAQQSRIYEVVRDGQWRSLRRISAITGDPEASVSARLRDFRKPKFGGFQVDRRRVKGGLFEYRLRRPE